MTATPRRGRQHLRRILGCLRDDGGQDMVEYALLASWISIVAILALQAIGPHLFFIFAAVKFALMTVRGHMP